MDMKMVIGLVLVVVLLDLVLQSLRSIRMNKRLTRLEEQMAALTGGKEDAEEAANEEE